MNFEIENIPRSNLYIYYSNSFSFQR